MRKLSLGPLVGAALLFSGLASANELPSAVSQFKQSAQQLSSSPADAMHPATVAAMRDMARALRAIPGIDGEHAIAIEAKANSIERSSKKSHRHEDAAKSALEHAIMGLASLPPCSGLDAKLSEARASVRRIDDDRAFLKQKRTIDQAFGEVADAIDAASVCGNKVTVVPPLEERQPVSGQLSPIGEVHHIKLSRKMFDTMGDSADFDALCGAAGVRHVEIDRTAGDIAAGVFTAGFYTPVHLWVTCNPKR